MQSVIVNSCDLAASAIKRNYNVKDYGTLIDMVELHRFDSVIFTAPVVYWAIITV
ncbi:MAG: phosphatidate cytidylyltransferase [Lachnospira pectinoschiza]